MPRALTENEREVTLCACGRVAVLYGFCRACWIALPVTERSVAIRAALPRDPATESAPGMAGTLMSMANPYADTPLWAKWYSLEMGWPVTEGVRNAADGPVRCDGCGAARDSDGTPLGIDGSPDGLPSSYCFGCGAITCDRCVPEGIGPHVQSAHIRRSANSPRRNVQ